MGKTTKISISMKGSIKFFQRVSNFDNVFLVDEGIQIPLKVGHYRPARETPLAFRRCANDGPTLNASLVAL